MASRLIVRTALCVAFSGSFLSAGTLFTFDTDTPGTSTTFTDTVGGLSATFSSPSDPGGFTVTSGFFSSLTGNVLLDPGPAGADSIPLTVSFSSPLSNISLLFATNSGAGVFLVLDAFSGATLVGTASASGTVPGGFTFPEGALSFGGPTFDSIVLSSSALDFAVDSIDATPTPEPSSWGSSALGLGLLCYAYRRARFRRMRSRP